MVSLVTIAIVICALYFGKAVLVPFALALLLSFLLASPVAWLEKLKLGRAPSVVFLLALAVAAASGIAWLGTTQLAEIVSNLPHYQRNIQKKIEAMRSPAGNSLLRATQRIQQMSGELSESSASASETLRNLPAEGKIAKTSSASSRTRAPMPVELVRHQPGIAESFGSIGTPLVQFLETAAAVLIFTLFMLLQRGDLRNRLFRLFGSGHLNQMTTALDDAAQRVSRYLLTQSIVNATFGLLLGSGLYFIGVPNAPFWGVLGAILRFIPYVGTLVAGLCPLILALAVFDGWTRPMLTFGLFAGIELTMSAAIEPWLYGAHTGISSLAILVSAAFWTLLWGPIGLVLSTPMTVCLLVLGRYVPPLRFLSVLLGDEPVLPPEACYYQRLLALDEDEAQEVAEAYLKEKTVLDLYDHVLIPALHLAEQDRHEHALDEDRQKLIYETTKDLINQLSEETAYAPPARKVSVLCVPARDEADELVGLMLAHVLRLSGFSADAIAIAKVEDMLRSIEQRGTDILFISALPPFAVNQARSLCRRVRRMLPDLKVMVGFWDPTAEVGKIQERLGSDCVDKVITNLREAEFQVRLREGSTELQEIEPRAV
ncbi:MAG: AI-2E family transporter [Acidobacteriota bacterium]|nr:AI-2E family transporter [Acidobacteriota bacterium]